MHLLSVLRLIVTGLEICGCPISLVRCGGSGIPVLAMGETILLNPVGRVAERQNFGSL